MIRDATGKPVKSLSLKVVLQYMRGYANPGHKRSRLMKMRANGSPNGFAFYVVPGGYIEPNLASKIISRPDVFPGKDGLFPDMDQSWGMDG